MRRGTRIERGCVCFVLGAMRTHDDDGDDDDMLHHGGYAMFGAGPPAPNTRRNGQIKLLTQPLQPQQQQQPQLPQNIKFIYGIRASLVAQTRWALACDARWDLMFHIRNQRCARTEEQPLLPRTRIRCALTNIHTSDKCTVTDTWR